MLAVLGGLFVFVVVYNLFLSPPSRPGRKPSNSNAPDAASPSSSAATATRSNAPATAQPKAGGQPEEVVALLMQDLTPLDLRGPVKSGAVEPDKERGSVFAYYVPPPPPPVPPPPPPPITLQGVTPSSAVAGTPRKILLTIVANQIPEDAQLFFDGAPRPARRLNDHQIATDLEPSEYASQRTINITLKSASDPKMFSTSTAFMVQPAPEPQFRYVGRLGDKGLFELPGSPNKEYKQLGRGESIMGQWRIDAITDQGVDVTLTQYDIKRRVPLTDKTR